MASTSVSSVSGAVSGLAATLSSAGLFNQAFLLGLRLALRKDRHENRYSMKRKHIKNKDTCIAHPGTVLRGGSFVADDSPEDEWEVP